MENKIEMGQVCSSGQEGLSEKVASEMKPAGWGEAGTKVGEESSRQRERQVQRPHGGKSWEPIRWEKSE